MANPIITTIPYTVGAVYAPRFVALFRGGRSQEASDIGGQSALKTALLVVPITMVFVVASEKTMELLFTASYLRAAPVFRWYCVLTLGRIATFGSVIVAAGAPRLIFQAAVFSLLSNAVLCFVLVELVGFNGPAMGTALAFIPSVTYYCFCIAQATKLGFRQIFPLLGFLRVLALACLASLPAWWLKSAVAWPAAARLPAEALLVLGNCLARHWRSARFASELGIFGKLAAAAHAAHELMASMAQAPSSDQSRSSTLPKTVGLVGRRASTGSCAVRCRRW